MQSKFLELFLIFFVGPGWYKNKLGRKRGGEDGTQVKAVIYLFFTALNISYGAQTSYFVSKDPVYYMLLQNFWESAQGRSEGKKISTMPSVYIHQCEIYEMIRLNIPPWSRTFWSALTHSSGERYSPCSAQNDSKSAMIITDKPKPITCNSNSSLAAVDSKYYVVSQSISNETVKLPRSSWRCHPMRAGAQMPQRAQMYRTQHQTTDSLSRRITRTYCRRETSACVPIGIPTGMLVAGMLCAWN